VEPSGQASIPRANAYLEVRPTILETLMSRGGYALLAIAVVLGILGLLI
jgi:hypothetical protein